METNKIIVENIRNILAELWKKALELEQIPEPDQNFFDLGGNSFKAFFVVENLPTEYKSKIELTDFYDCETLEEMVQNIAVRFA